MEAANDSEGDLLLGADAIAKYLGIKRRQAYHLAQTGVIPVFKLGGAVAARRSTLKTWLSQQEAA